MGKYNKGDKIEIELTKRMAVDLENRQPTFFVGEHITKHTPAPFDWSNIKPGMAFKIWAQPLIYVGPDYSDAGRCFLHGKDGCFSIDKKILTRAPEHDVEVES